MFFFLVKDSLDSAMSLHRLKKKQKVKSFLTEAYVFFFRFAVLIKSKC